MVTLGLFSKELLKFELRKVVRFHQNIHIIEKFYQSRWDVNFFADYCWYLTRDEVAAKLRKKSVEIPFIQE